MEGERIGFEEKKTVNMKLYEVPADTARWFKIWCDRQGLRFNQGMVLIRQVISDYERFKKIEVVIEENRALISELYENKVKDTDKVKEPEKEPVKRPVCPATFGSKKR